MGICSLPWYDLPELRPETDALWAALARELVRRGFDGVPARVDREIDHDGILARPDLLLSQTCGLVAVGPARALVRPVGTPRYSAPGCEGSGYRSFVVVRAEHPAKDLAGLAGARCVVNEPCSHSGMNGLRSLVAPLHRGGRFFASVGLSGSHEASLEQLAAGRADVAAVDCVTYALVEARRPALLAGLRVVAETPLAPAPPFVTSAATGDAEAAALVDALSALAADPALTGVRTALHFEGVEPRPLEDYAGMLAAERAALDAGYAEMPWRAEPRGSYPRRP